MTLPLPCPTCRTLYQVSVPEAIAEKTCCFRCGDCGEWTLFVRSREEQPQVGQTPALSGRHVLARQSPTELPAGYTTMGFTELVHRVCDWRGQMGDRHEYYRYFLRQHPELGSIISGQATAPDSIPMYFGDKQSGKH